MVDELISTSKLAARNRANAILEAQEALNVNKEAVRAGAARAWYADLPGAVTDITGMALDYGAEGLSSLLPSELAGYDLPKSLGIKRFQKAMRDPALGYKQLEKFGVDAGYIPPTTGTEEEERARLLAGFIDPVPLPVGAMKFTSPAIGAVKEIKQNKMPANQWISQMSSRGVSKDELYWTGVEDWLKSKDGSVTKQELDEYLGANQIQVQEIVKGLADPKEKELLVRGNVADELTHLMDNDEYLYEMSDEIQPLIERYRTGDETVKAELDELFQSYAFQGESMVDSAIRVELEDMALNPREAERLAGGETKFSTQVEPGGENYRELLLTLPSKNVPFGTSKPQWLIDTGRAENMPDAARLSVSRKFDAEWTAANRKDFTEGHYDEPNVIAHIRFNERTDADGKKVLFIEEFQSDWAHKGQDAGFVGEKAKDYLNSLSAGNRKIAERMIAEGKANPDILASGEFDQDWLTLSRTQPELEHNIIHDTVDEFTGIKNLEATAGPFVMDTHQWTALSLKRMVRWAADNDFDSIGWTTGKMQADRYNLSKRVDGIKVVDLGAENVEILGKLKGEDLYRTLEAGVPRENLSDYIGKELADKALKELERQSIDIVHKVPGPKPEPSRLRYEVWDEEGSIDAFTTREAAENALETAASDHGGYWREAFVVDSYLKDLDEYNKQAKKGIRVAQFEGIDLELGGDYVKFIYDKVLPAQAKKLGKKYGAKVGEVEIVTQEAGALLTPHPDDLAQNVSPEHIRHIFQSAPEVREKVWSMDLTDKLKKAAKDGLPYYVALPPIAAGVASQAEAADVKRSAVEVKTDRILEEASL